MAHSLSNKAIGASFEAELCDLLRRNRYWVHFCTPSASGAQPCDIIACQDGCGMIIDAKTTSTQSFALDRIEDNQRLAFERFLQTGNIVCGICVKELATGRIYWLPWVQAKRNIKAGIKRMRLSELYEFPFGQ